MLVPPGRDRLGQQVGQLLRRSRPLAASAGGRRSHRPEESLPRAASRVPGQRTRARAASAESRGPCQRGVCARRADRCRRQRRARPRRARRGRRVLRRGQDARRPRRRRRHGAAPRLLPERSWRDDMELGAAELALAGQALHDPRTAAWLRAGKIWAREFLAVEAGRDTLNLYDTSALAHTDLVRALRTAHSGSDLQNRLVADLRAQLARASTRATPTRSRQARSTTTSMPHRTRSASSRRRALRRTDRRRRASTPSRPRSAAGRSERTRGASRS